MHSLLKRLVSFLLVGVLCFALAAPALAASSYVRITHSVKVNVRTGPSTCYSSFASVSPKEEFPYLGYEDGWYKIDYYGRTGYVYSGMADVVQRSGGSDAVSSATSSSSSSGSSSSATDDDEYVEVVVITHYQKVNVRTGPSTGYRTIGEASPNDVYIYLDTVDGWYKILFNGKEGYLSSNLSSRTYRWVSYDWIESEYMKSFLY